MVHAGYAIVTQSGARVMAFDSLPTYIAWPDGSRTEPAVPMDYAEWRFLERWLDLPEETRTKKLSDVKEVVSGDRLEVFAILVDRTPEEIATWDAEHVPGTVNALHFRLALLEAGILDAVEAYVAKAPRDVQLAWEFHGEIDYDNPLVTAAAGALGVNDAGLRALFVRAAAIEPGRQ